MPTLREFAHNFNGCEIPNELLQLLEFQNNSGYGEFSEGFGLASEVKEGLSYGWSNNPDFLNNLFPFAKANGSGSFYAFWNDSTSDNLSEMPIVIFGDEGGEHIVAENLVQLLQILTFDSEPMVDHDKVIFYKLEQQYQPSPKLDSFKKWVNETFNITSIDSPDEIVNLAQKKYQTPFNAWKMKYLEV